MFGDQFPADFYIQQCQDIFGSRFNSTFLDRAVYRTNAIYGGLDIDVTNVVFVHGSIDPWHALGITKTKEQDAPAIYIEGNSVLHYLNDLFHYGFLFWQFFTVYLTSFF